MTDIIARAKQLLEGTTPSPWKWERRKNSDNGRGFDRLGNDNDTALETQDPDEYESWVESSAEDMALIAAAPELAEVIAGMEYEYAVQVKPTLAWMYLMNWHEMNVIPESAMWFKDKAKAELLMSRHYRKYPKRIVRRMVSPVEVVG